LLAPVASHLHLVRPGDTAKAGHALDAVFVHEEVDAACHLADDAVLALHHRTDIHGQPVGRNAVRAKVLPRPVKQLGGREQRLAGNAADVEAGAAEGFALLDDGRLHAELRRPDRGGVPARPGPYDDEIKIHFSNL
jgi:hypothetical protein